MPRALCGVFALIVTLQPRDWVKKLERPGTKRIRIDGDFSSALPQLLKYCSTRNHPAYDKVR